MNQIQQDIFREYDIRGLVDSELQDDVVEKIASAFATVYIQKEKKKIAVGMDGRPSSDHIKNILISGLKKYGLDVLDIGLVPTPVMYYAVFKMDLGGGIIVTASHNPPEYNGFKALEDKMLNPEIRFKKYTAWPLRPNFRPSIREPSLK